MNDLIEKLSNLRSQFNCFDENERDAYHTLSEAIKVLSERPEPCEDNKHCSNCIYSGRPTYKSPCSECRDNSQWEMKPISRSHENGTECEDTISRQAAIDALKGLPTWWADDGGFYGGAQPPMTALLDPEDAVSAIANLPSVTPKHKPWKWIEYDSDEDKYDVIKYPCCKHTFTVDAYHWTDIGFVKDDFKFCPNCSADMRGKQDE